MLGSQQLKLHPQFLLHEFEENQSFIETSWDDTTL